MYRAGGAEIKLGDTTCLLFIERQAVNLDHDALSAWNPVDGARRTALFTLGAGYRVITLVDCSMVKPIAQ